MGFVDQVTGRVAAGLGDELTSRMKAAISNAQAAIEAQARAEMSVRALELEAMMLAGRVKTAEEIQKGSLPFWGGIAAGILMGAGVVCSIFRE